MAPLEESASKRTRGQVAQMVERSPEKAGVGGSIPSLATMIFKHLRDLIFLPWLRLAAIPQFTIWLKPLSRATTLRCDSGTNCW